MLVIFLLLAINYLHHLNAESSMLKSNLYITGSTGILGQALVKELFISNKKISNVNAVYASYRNKDKAIKMKSSLNHEIRTLESKNNLPNLQFFDMDVRLRQTSPYLTIPALGKCTQTSHLILINNAGVYLREKTRGSMEESLLVNTLTPYFLTQQFLESADSSVADQISIVNISSGDGELVYLDTDLAEQIKALDSLVCFTEFAKRLVEQFDSHKQYAFGAAPFYALSKALLNQLTVLQHNYYQNYPKKNIRILACCPGNFNSPMSEEEEANDAISPQEAAQNVLELALHFDLYKSGHFYRNKEPIPW